MTPEERELFRQTFDLVKENNVMLRKMRRTQLWGAFTKVLYYGLIVGSFFGAYYLIQPYLQSLVGAVGGDTSETSTFGTMMENFKNIGQ
jgi:hypothetical protein